MNKKERYLLQKVLKFLEGEEGCIVILEAQYRVVKNTDDEEYIRTGYAFIALEPRVSKMGKNYFKRTFLFNVKKSEFFPWLINYCDKNNITY